MIQRETNTVYNICAYVCRPISDRKAHAVNDLCQLFDGYGGVNTPKAGALNPRMESAICRNYDRLLSHYFCPKMAVTDQTILVPI